MITHHTNLLNSLIEKYNLRTYVELGVQNPANNFDKINALFKDGVDPCLTTEYNGKVRLIGATSDEYFERWASPNKIEIAFIDGLHTKEQVKKDFDNCLLHLNDNGFILIHDVLPENEAGTAVPRATKQWWGDVYKWAMNIGQYRDISFVTFNIDNGCMLVKKSPDRS